MTRRVQAGNGIANAYTFDGITGRLQAAAVGGGTLEDLEYVYRDDDLVQDILDHRAPALGRSFTYDPLKRLRTAVGPYREGYVLGARVFTYDPLGNLLCKDATSASSCTGGSIRTYPAPGQPRPHAPVSVDGLAVGYDAAGNVTTFDGRTFGYDTLGRMTSATDSGLASEFRYDENNRMARSTINGDLRVFPTEDFEYDATAGRARIRVQLGGRTIALHEEDFTPSGGPTCGAVPGGIPTPSGTLLVFIVPCGAAWLAICLIHGAPRLRPGRLREITHAGVGISLITAQITFPLALFQTVPARAASPPVILFLHGDHLRSSILITDDAGTPQRFVYDPFGSVVPATVGGSAAAPAYGFTGQRFEGELAIYDYGARWYDPSLGLFLQPDAIIPDVLDPRELNPFAYVLNNPVNRTDPTGYASSWTEWAPYYLEWASISLEHATESHMQWLLQNQVDEYYWLQDFYDGLALNPWLQPVEDSPSGSQQANPFRTSSQTAQNDGFRPLGDAPAYVQERVSPEEYDAIRAGVRNLEERGAIGFPGEMAQGFFRTERGALAPTDVEEERCGPRCVWTPSYLERTPIVDVHSHNEFGGSVASGPDRISARAGGFVGAVLSQHGSVHLFFYDRRLDQVHGWFARGSARPF